MTNDQDLISKWGFDKASEESGLPSSYTFQDYNFLLDLFGPDVEEGTDTVENSDDHIQDDIKDVPLRQEELPQQQQQQQQQQLPEEPQQPQLVLEQASLTLDQHQVVSTNHTAESNGLHTNGGPVYFHPTLMMNDPNSYVFYPWMFNPFGNLDTCNPQSMYSPMLQSLSGAQNLPEKVSASKSQHQGTHVGGKTKRSRSEMERDLRDGPTVSKISRLGVVILSTKEHDHVIHEMMETGANMVLFPAKIKPTKEEAEAMGIVGSSKDVKFFCLADLQKVVKGAVIRTGNPGYKKNGSPNRNNYFLGLRLTREQFVKRAELAVNVVDAKGVRAMYREKSAIVENLEISRVFYCVHESQNDTYFVMINMRIEVSGGRGPPYQFVVSIGKELVQESAMWKLQSKADKHIFMDKTPSTSEAVLIHTIRKDPRDPEIYSSLPMIPV